MSVAVARPLSSATAATTSGSAAATATAAAAGPPAVTVMAVPPAVFTRLHILGQQLECNGRRRHLVPDVVLDLRQRHRVFLARETDRVAFRAGSRRAAD